MPASHMLSVGVQVRSRSEVVVVELRLQMVGLQVGQLVVLPVYGPDLLRTSYTVNSGLCSVHAREDQRLTATTSR